MEFHILYTREVYRIVRQNQPNYFAKRKKRMRGGLEKQKDGQKKRRGMGLNRENRKEEDDKGKDRNG